MPLRRSLGLLASAVLATSLASPAFASVPSPAVASVVSLGGAASARVDDPRVLAISIDGLNPAAIKRLGPTKAPTFYRLMAEGAFTLNARTEVEQTVTLPNHTSMLTGRRIDPALGGHGVTWDDDRPGSTVQRGAGHPVASIFTTVHESGGSTALFATKTKFSLYQRSWPKSIDLFRASTDVPRLVGAARSDLKKSDRDFTFLHISLPDLAGHASGFMSPAYVEAVRRTDLQLERLVRAIGNSPELSADLTVVLTADHGGKGAGHSDSSLLGDYRIPFIVWGAGVTPGDLYAMNADYTDPGKTQPSYADPPPIRNGDMANLSADLLGLDPAPGSLFDVTQTLTATTVPARNLLARNPLARNPLARNLLAG